MNNKYEYSGIYETRLTSVDVLRSFKNIVILLFAEKFLFVLYKFRTR